MHDSLPLPNNGNEKEESGPTFILRITPPEDNDYFSFIIEKFKHYDGFDYLITEEISKEGVLHYHIVCKCSDPFETFQNWARKEIVYILYPAPRPKGFGIKQWHCTVSDNPHNAVVYALKEVKITRRFYYSGYTEEYIEECMNDSFTKSNRSAFTNDFTELKKKFQESSMTIEEFMDQFIILKGKHDQMVNLSHAYQYALSALVKRDPSAATKLVRSFLNKNSY